MSLRNLVLGSVLLASIVMASLVPVGLAFEVDTTDSVTRVVDGDTFDTVANGRVRLADVDAPESDEPGFDEASDALEGMIGNREVYLDIDDKGSTSFGRLICVVYVRHNSTHVLNVNRPWLTGEERWLMILRITSSTRQHGQHTPIIPGTVVPLH